ncbi:methyltransferase [Streptomyces sp. NPDC096153]|uniref:methyltransferase n=1 Tax=Streptomyces sp. NPDC096153 TaxID=3155548 RepID=UPI003326B14A
MNVNQALRKKIMGHIVSQAIHAVTLLKVPDALAGQPLHLDQLAAATGADADALHRFMRVLVAEGVFCEPQAGTYALTDMGELLRTDTPGSLSHLSTLMAGEAYEAWGAAVHSLRTGRPTFDHLYGAPYFEWLAQNPRASRAFHDGQAGLVQMRLLPLLNRDWTSIGTVADIGGGNGTLMMTLLEQNPHLSGVVFDLPQALDQAEEAIADAGLGGRAACAAGDFFKAIPPGSDVYVLSQILHDWDDERAAQILQSCRAAAGPGSRLLILDQVLPHDSGSQPAALLDLHMLILLGGRERTEAAWKDLIERCGFRVVRDIEHGPRSSLIEAVPV